MGDELKPTCHLPSRHWTMAPNQSLRPFIEFNTAKRRLAKTDFAKDLFKLMNNSGYGKIMENVGTI